MILPDVNQPNPEALQTNPNTIAGYFEDSNDAFVPLPEYNMAFRETVNGERWFC